MDDGKNSVSLSVFACVALVLLAIIFWQANTIRKLRTASAPTIKTQENQGSKIEPTKAVKMEATKAPTETPSPEPTPTPEFAPKDLVLFDNEDITITYERMYEEYFGDNVYFRMVVYATNRSDKEIMFLFDDTTVNDEMTNIISGHEVLPGKSGRFICTVDHYLLSIHSMHEINVIETKVRLWDEHLNDMIKPQELIMDFTGGTE